MEAQIELFKVLIRELHRTRIGGCPSDIASSYFFHRSKT